MDLITGILLALKIQKTISCIITHNKIIIENKVLEINTRY